MFNRLARIAVVASACAAAPAMADTVTISGYQWGAAPSIDITTIFFMGQNLQLYPCPRC